MEEGQPPVSPRSDKKTAIIAGILAILAIGIMVTIIILVINRPKSQTANETTNSNTTTSQNDEDDTSEDEPVEPSKKEYSVAASTDNPYVLTRNDILFAIYNTTPENVNENPDLESKIEQWINQNISEFGKDNYASIDAHMMMAFYYLKSGRTDDAYQYLENYISTTSNTTAIATALREEYFFAQQTNDTARQISALEKLLALPDSTVLPEEEWSIVKENYKEELNKLRNQQSGNE